ncbi:unnamed protein product, partial [Polarella glacialis]
ASQRHMSGSAAKGSTAPRPEDSRATAFLGEVFWVELPVVGKTFSEGTIIATLEGMRHPPGTEDRGHAMPLKGKGVDFAEQEMLLLLLLL